MPEELKEPRKGLSIDTIINAGPASQYSPEQMSHMLDRLVKVIQHLADRIEAIDGKAIVTQNVTEGVKLVAIPRDAAPVLYNGL